MKRFFIRLIYPHNILNSKYFECNTFDEAFKIQENFKSVFEFEVVTPKYIDLYDEFGFVSRLHDPQ